MDLLHSTRGKQLAQQLEADQIWQNPDYVLTQSDGGPMNSIKVTQEFRAIVRKAGLQHRPSTTFAMPTLPYSWSLACLPRW